MEKYRLIVDTRERKVFKNLEGSKYDYQVKTMTVGDYAIMMKSPTIDDPNRELIVYIIERKTWKDLSGSIKDGRIDNHKKLMALRQQTGCRIVLLIEGQPFPNVKNKIGNISAKALISHIDHMATRDQFMIIHTKNKDHTVSRIWSLMESHNTIKWNKYSTTEIPSKNRLCNDVLYHMTMLKQSLMELTSTTTDSGMELHGGDLSTANGGNLSTANDGRKDENELYKKHTKDDDMIQMKMMQAIPRLSFSMASNIYQLYSIKKLISGTYEKSSLAILRHPSGTPYGEKLEKSISKVSNICSKLLTEENKYPPKKTINRDVRVQILSQVVGISESVAIIILQETTLPDLISKSEVELADFKIGDRRLGTKKSQNILRILNI